MVSAVSVRCRPRSTRAHHAAAASGSGRRRGCTGSARRDLATVRTPSRSGVGVANGLGDDSVRSGTAPLSFGGRNTGRGPKMASNAGLPTGTLAGTAGASDSTRVLICSIARRSTRRMRALTRACAGASRAFPEALCRREIAGPETRRRGIAAPSGSASGFGALSKVAFRLADRHAAGAAFARSPAEAGNRMRREMKSSGSRRNCGSGPVGSVLAAAVARECVASMTVSTPIVCRRNAANSSSERSRRETGGTGARSSSAT
mmetsp:Transcript_14687/g.45533  ORF Transcript_14687/g.45533 Transcript_14687/m.45533 type:complete len:261 (+) Transcript_14687:1030-1812(+)